MDSSKNESSQTAQRAGLTSVKRSPAEKTRGRNGRLQTHVKETAGKCCTLTKRKSPTPKLKDLVRKKPITQTKNHVCENIRRAKNLKCAERSPIVQDSCDGHREDAERAGLQLKYVFKKDYGQTPRYIRQRVKQNTEQPVENDVNGTSNLRTISDEEKQLVLDGLKGNLREIEKRLLSLPIVTDTISKQKRKLDLENRLLQLQQDIEMLEMNDIIVIKE